MKTRVCSKCGAEKSMTEFYRQASCRDGIRPECKACTNARCREYHQSHREALLPRLRVQSRRHYWQNRERYAKRRQDAYTANRPEILARNAAYAQAHPEVQIQASRNYRARKQNAAGAVTRQEWDEVLEHYGHSCLRCGALGDLVMDHIVPLSRGGANEKANVQPLCRRCNNRKFTRATDFRPDKGAWAHAR